MDFSFNEEQEAVRSWPPASSETGHPRAVAGASRRAAAAMASTATCGPNWPAPASLGIALPETYGGAGLGFVEACIVVEAAARAAASYRSSRRSPWARPPSPPTAAPHCGRRLPGVVAGTTVVTTALAEPGGLWASPSVVAEPAGDGWSARRA